LDLTSLGRFSQGSIRWENQISFERSIIIVTILHRKAGGEGVLQAFFPRISITDPVLSSFAGTNPPNPVLAVRSGNLELELEPLSLSFKGDFFNKLFVTSGIEFRLLNLKLELKLVVELTDPPPTLKFTLEQVVTPGLTGPFVVPWTGSLLVFTVLGGLKVKLLDASVTESAFSITEVGAEKLNFGCGVLTGGLMMVAGCFTSTVDFDPLLALLGGGGLVAGLDADELNPSALARCFLEESLCLVSSSCRFWGLLLLFLSIGSGTVGVVEQNPLEVVIGGLVAGVEVKLKTGI